jgi:predicted ester cyclase
VHGMLPELNKTVVRRYFEAYDTGDIDAVMEFIHPNHVYHPGGEESLDFDARKRDDQVFFSAFSNVKTIVEDQIAEGDKVASRITMQCTHTGKFQGISATRKRIVITLMDISLIKDGKILEEWVEFDMMNILKQISVRDPQQ